MEQPTPKITEHNVTTGKITVRDLTPKEMEQWKLDHAEADANEQKRLQDLRQFQADWNALQKDDVSHEVIVRLLRRLLPHKPE